HDRPCRLDGEAADGVGVLQPAPPHHEAGVAVAQQPQPEAMALPVLALVHQAGADVGTRRCTRPRPQRAVDARVQDQLGDLDLVLGPDRLTAHPRRVEDGGRERLFHDAGAGAAGVSAICSLQRTSAGSPRSGNGISMASKSRGTTVLGKMARASSRSWRSGWRVETWLSA